MSKLKNKHDISEEQLENLLQRFRNTILPQKLIEISRESFDFFTRSPARLFEYVWLAKTLKRVEGKRILDIGAGISPMPIYFALQGAKVTTIDNSQMVRSWPEEKVNWNEWGFIDYGLRFDRICSFNRDINELSFKTDSFDYIYSISVLEHMPASIRQDLWKKLNNWLVEKGLLVLTMDFYKGSDYLWNFAYGSMVEFVEKHGNISSLEGETAPFFKLEKKKIEGISDLLMDTDVFLYKMRKL